LLGEEGAREDREGRVLVPRRHHGAGQRDASFDDELLHERCTGPSAPERSAGMAPGTKRNSHLCTGVRAAGPCPCLARRKVAGGAQGVADASSVADLAPQTRIAKPFLPRWV